MKIDVAVHVGHCKCLKKKKCKKVQVKLALVFECSAFGECTDCLQSTYSTCQEFIY